MSWLTQDRQRLELFRQGDPMVLRQVYDQYAPGLARSLTNGVKIESQGRHLFFEGWRSAFEVDDLLQETFLRAFSSDARSSYDGIRSFSSWLLAIARNLLVDNYRKSQRLMDLLVPLPDDAAESVDLRREASPEMGARDRELAAAINAFVETLEKNERILLQLRLEDGASRKETSRKTGWSAMQVRVREKKLIQQLMDILEQQTLNASSNRSAGDAPL
jgi:RNA polymerase sigma factor (sigma-70 family)